MALPNVSSTELPFQDAHKHIIFRGNFNFEFQISFCSDDIKDLERLKLRLGVPQCPPNHSNISRDVLILQNKIAARYAGVPSFNSLETPKGGFQTQNSLLRDIRRGYQVLIDAVHLLSVGHQESGRQRSRNYVNYGAPSSGKNLCFCL